MIVMGMNGTRLPSLLVAFVVFMALSVVNLIAFHSMNERDWVKSRYEAVRTSSNLFASLRSHDDFGSAIEATQSLKGNILGFGLYDEAGSLLYRWGEAPDAYTQPAFDDAEVLQDQTRMYVENPDHDSLVVLMEPKDEPPPLPPDVANNRTIRTPPVTFETLRKTHMIYLEVHQPWFWRNMRLLTALCPTVEVLVAALVGFVWFLVITNQELLRRIKQQKIGMSSSISPTRRE